MSDVVIFSDTSNPNSRPAGPAVLASYLRKHNITTQTLWSWFSVPEPIFKMLCKKYISDTTKVVGISTTTLNLSDRPTSFWAIDDGVFIERINYIRSISPQAKIVVGGSKIRKQVIIPNIEYVDYVVSGQGESALLWIVQNYDQPVKNKFISDVDIPFNDFSTSETEFKKEDYIQPNEALFVEFARGCIFKCSFCDYHLNGKKRGDYTKQLGVLKQEFIKNYEMYGTQYYSVTDDLINDSQAKVDDIYNLTQQLPFRIHFGGYLRLDLIWRYPEMARQLKESGLVSTFFGIETINDASGKSIGKGLGIERTTEALATCASAWNREVFTTGAFILGLPHDNPDTKYQLMEWLAKPEIRNVINAPYIYPLFLSPNRSKSIIIDSKTTETNTGLSDIDANPAKFGYSIKSRSTRLPGTQTNYAADWYTKNYSYDQALDDSAEVKAFFNRDKTFVNTEAGIGVFNYPLILGLTPHKKELVSALTLDKSTLWGNNQELIAHVNELYTKLKNDYLMQALKKK
jgi:radical SAM superfamily enzyme YgiQ (UPF0313 family)